LLIAFSVIFLNLYLRNTHILGIREAAMTHMALGASMAASCYAGNKMWRRDYRKSDYDQTTEKGRGGIAAALAECLRRLPDGCNLRNRDERGAA
jgi:hypothetical protein